MTTVKILIFAILTITCQLLCTEPPTFSQQNLCCWLASWMQLVYNMRPIAERLLTTDDKLFSDFEVFKKSAMGEKLANEKIFTIKRNPITNENEFVEVSALEKAKPYFEPDAIKITKAYKKLFMAMHETKRDQDKLDNRLETLQKVLQTEGLGECSLPGFDVSVDVSTGAISASKGLAGHPIFRDLISYKMGADLKNIYNYEDLTPILVIEPTPQKLDESTFSLDMTPLIIAESGERQKQTEKCLQYELSDIAIRTGRHFIAFIREQYGPLQQWWRCDTMQGNRKVTHQNILQEFPTIKGNTVLAYTVKKDCKKVVTKIKENEGQEQLSQGDTDLMQLTLALKKLAE
ncbi:MAG: hypothetical protein M1549_04345 [Candidatus Dependentiae bacterium]|nr:hypothetical protein [Candidatus Dependentiae bacterium]